MEYIYWVAVVKVICTPHDKSSCIVSEYKKLIKVTKTKKHNFTSKYIDQIKMLTNRNSNLMILSS